MKKLLYDYIFDERLRYEKHKLVYTPQEGEPIVFGGILAAALLCVRLLNTDEQNERAFCLSEELHYEPFFAQYEQEVIGDDWGYIDAELEQLDLAYLELCSNEQITIETICPNKRQLSIVSDVVVTYMRRIAIERYGAHIYELVPWSTPFARWLFDAAYAEPRRQQFLTIDWTDPALVHELACKMEKAPTEQPNCLFENEEAADIMARYWDWLWNYAQKDAATFPDANAVMADYKASILANETDWDFIKPEMKDFAPDQINLFHKWMNQWTDFVHSQIQPAADKRRKKEEQLFYPDEVLQCPTEDMPEKYAATREYVKERSKYDENFRKFVKNESFAKLCRQLTLLFGWFVEPTSLRKSMLRNPKRRTKKYV
jgi:hypothetical protein